MSSQPRTRVDFAGGGMLTAQDFSREQAYHLQTQALRCRSLHTWGIASGLEVSVRPGGLSVTIAPGLAIDGQGREILLSRAQDLDLSDQITPVVYLCIGLTTAYEDWRIYPLGSGHVRLADQAILSVTPDPPLLYGQIVPLAKLSFTPERRLAAPDLSVRQICGLVVGEMTLTPPEAIDGADPLTLSMDSEGQSLVITSPLTDLFGSMAISGAAAVGLESPADTALAVQTAAPVPGAGTISSDGATIFGADAYDLAALTPGDQLLTALTPGGPLNQPLTIVAVSGQTVTVNPAPNTPLTGSSYEIARGALMRIRTDALTTALEVSAQGLVSVGGGPGGALLTVRGGDLLLDQGDDLRFLQDGAVQATGAGAGQVHALRFLASANTLEIRESGQIVFGAADDPEAPPGLLLAADQNVGVGVSVPAYPLTVDGEIRASDGVIFADGSHQTAGVAAIPIGTVISWWSSNLHLPWTGDGFQLCDGSTITDPASPLVGTKTPDLRQVYVRGVVNYEQIGQTGGATSHTHGFTMAQHTHRTDHTHAISGFTTTVVGKAGDDIAGSSVSKNDHAHAIDTSSSNNAPNNTGTNSSVAPGTTGSAADLPPYMTLLRAIRVR